MTRWFEFDVRAERDVAELVIFGAIGDEAFPGEQSVSAKECVNALSALPVTVTTILVRINSFGGSVFDGLAIANALRDQHVAKRRSVVARVEGIAASAASVVAMGCETIVMSPLSMMMVHLPSVFCFGNADDKRKVGDTLDKIAGQMVTAYQWHAASTPEAILALLRDETWMGATEAVSLGFATSVAEEDGADPAVEAVAKFRPSALAPYRNVPAAFRARFGEVTSAHLQGQPANPLELMTLCREAGVDLAFAEAMARDRVTLHQAQARLNAHVSVIAAERARTDRIRGMCKMVHMNFLADDFIAGGMAAERVGPVLLNVTALLDGKIQIDSHLDPDLGAQTETQIDAGWKKAIAAANVSRKEARS